MANTYGKQQISEKGIANYIYINTRINEYQGKPTGYGVTLKFAKAYTEKLKKELEDFLSEVQNSEEGKKKEWSRDPYPGYTKDEKGDIIFKFKSIKKDDNDEYLKIKLKDSKNNDMPLNTNIGSGSTMRVDFTPTVYWNSKKDNGVTLYINKAQVVKLEEYTGGANLDFPEDDGYIGDISFPEDDTPPI
jgi:hypothetical protein